MSAAINDNNMKKKGWVKQFREEEFLVALGPLIGSVEYGTRGKELWVTKSHNDADKDAEIEKWDSFIYHPNFDKHVRAYRFHDFCKYPP
jgi:hypothetical protein